MLSDKKLSSLFISLFSLILLGLILFSCSQARSIARKAEQASNYKKKAAVQIAELSALAQSESWPQISKQPKLQESIDVKIITSKGPIEAQLAFQLAPLASATFLYLAQLPSSGAADRPADPHSYIGASFYRPAGAVYIKAGSDSALNDLGFEGVFPLEYSEWLNFREAGALAFSVSPDQGYSEGYQGSFFISLAAQPDLFGKFAAFGQIQKGLDVAQRLSSEDQIQSVEIQASGQQAQKFLTELQRDGAKMLERLRKTVPYHRQGLAAIHQKLAYDFVAVQWPRNQKQKLQQVSPSKQASPAEKVSTQQAQNWGLEYKVLEAGEQANSSPKLSDLSFEQIQLQYAVWATQNDGRSLLLEDRIQNEKSIWATPEQLFPAWRAALLDMRPGERRLYIIPPEGAYGIRGKPPDIPPWSYLIMELYLLDIR